MKEKRAISKPVEESTEKIHSILKLDLTPIYLPSAINLHLSDRNMALCHFELTSAVNQNSTDSHSPSVS